MAQKKKVNINTVKKYYIRHDISLRQLAQRYKISYATVLRYKKEGNWEEEKAAYRAEVEEKAIEQLKEDDAKKLVEAHQKLAGIIESAVKVLDGISRDDEQFYRQSTSPNERLMGVQEYIGTKVDTKSLLNYVKTISEINNCIKNYNNDNNNNDGINIGFEEMEKDYAE